MKPTYTITCMRDVEAYFGNHSVIGPKLAAWAEAYTAYRDDSGPLAASERFRTLKTAKEACLAEVKHYGSTGSVDVSAAEARALDDEVLPDMARAA